MRRTAIVLAVIAAIFLAAAALLAFWVTPQFVARLPSDSNTTRTYDGQIRTLLDPALLRQGNLGAAVGHGLPETISREVKVLQTSGDTALVQDTSTVDSAGQRIGELTAKYAVDRHSLEATTSHPSDWSVTNARGLTVNWPVGAGQQNYTGWVSFTQTTTQLRYLRQEQHGGVNTYVYQANLAATPIKNPQVLQSLPKALPVSLLQGAGQSGLVPPSVLAALPGSSRMRPMIPLGYTYEGTSTYWVAPRTGIVVDISTSEKQRAGVALPGGKIIPVVPVLDDSYQGNQASVQAAATDAKNGSGTIQTVGTTIPIVLAVVGFVLAVIAVILLLRGRRRGSGRATASGEPPHDSDLDQAKGTGPRADGAGPPPDGTRPAADRTGASPNGAGRQAPGARPAAPGRT